MPPPETRGCSHALNAETISATPPCSCGAYIANDSQIDYSMGDVGGAGVDINLARQIPAPMEARHGMGTEFMGRRDGSGLIAAFREHYYDLLRLLTRRTGNVERAADIAQDTYIRLAAIAPEGAHIENSRAYIYRIAGNLAIDTMRREVREAWRRNSRSGPLPRTHRYRARPPAPSQGGFGSVAPQGATGPFAIPGGGSEPPGDCQALWRV